MKILVNVFLTIIDLVGITPDSQDAYISSMAFYGVNIVFAIFFMYAAFKAIVQ